MSARRKTLDRDIIVAKANLMLNHLSAKTDDEADEVLRKNKREAIIAATSSILLAGNSYAGFRYLNPPDIPYETTDSSGKIWTGFKYDESRVNFY